MSRVPNQKAVKAAKEVHALLFTKHTPPAFNPFKMADNLFVHNTPNGEQGKARIIHRPLKKSDQELSAKAFYDHEKGAYVCEYNAEEIYNRSSYAMAWMLGHVLLGHVSEPGSVKSAKAFQISESDHDNLAATDFAMELLMPRNWCKSYLLVAKSIEQLSEAFGVSTNAMTYRIKSLGLI